MEFVELTEKEYKNYWESHPLKTFMSDPKISKLRKHTNWSSYFVGIKEKDAIIAAAMLLSHKRKFNVNEFYSPRGFLLDFNNKELLNYFTNSIKKFIKKKKGYVLRIDPYVIYKQRDINGDIVENGEDNSEVVKNLKSLGFKQVDIDNTEQVSWMFSLDLENKNEDELLKEMSGNTRNIIRKTEKFGIKLKELSYDELDRFEKIMIETGERKGFSIRNLQYYQNMYNLLNNDGEIKYYITELNLNDYIDSLEKEKTENTNKLNKLADKKENEGARKNFETVIESLDKRIIEAEEMKKDSSDGVITLSCAMFIMIQPEIIFLAGGNYEKYMKFNSQHLIQWSMIKYGLENKFKKHNFYGIPANINTHPKDYGIYEFKKRFGGYVEELIGEYELPLTYHYYIFKILHKIRGGK